MRGRFETLYSPMGRPSEFASIQPGHGAASFADFVGGNDFLFLAIQAAAQNETGERVDQPVDVDILAVDDGSNEPIEDFRVVIDNEKVTNGAEPGQVIPGPRHQLHQ